MRLGVVGVGVVGGTLVKYLKRVGHDVLVDDPPKGISGDLTGCEAVFICVPVPTGPAGQDASILRDAVKKHRNAGPLFVRSTVLPKTCDNLSKEFDVRIYACPEFLTEREAEGTMASQPIIAGVLDYLADYSNQEALLSRVFPDKDVILMSNCEAELAKYAHNCMGALKVTFFNGIDRYCRMIGANYDSVLRGVLASGYINATHTQVPGPDGQYGYGGKCFPENINSFLKEVRRLGLQHRLIQAVQDENAVYRRYKSPDEGVDPPPAFL